VLPEALLEATLPRSDAVSTYAWRSCLRHRYAIDLYHYGFHWEAHEVWEELWHRVPKVSSERQSLAGLIQLTASALKLRMGHHRAAATLLKNAQRNLTSSLRAVEAESNTSECLAIALPPLIEAAEVWAMNEQETPPPTLPFLGTPGGARFG
jgi:predicted metal-dependent hydrolase